MCSKGPSCAHKEGHRVPLSAEMREACQRIIAARARKVQATKGGGKGKGGPQIRRFQLLGL